MTILLINPYWFLFLILVVFTLMALVAECLDRRERRIERDAHRQARTGPYHVEGWDE